MPNHLPAVGAWKVTHLSDLKCPCVSNKNYYAYLPEKKEESNQCLCNVSSTVPGE